MATLTATRLRSLLSYDPETGVFRWLEDHVWLKAGDVAGGIGAKGYWLIGVDGVRYYGHRLAWLYMTSEWPTGKVDHEDTDRTNNRWKNLRPATTRQNATNSGLKPSNKSGFKGVSFNKKLGRWQAHIRIAGRSTYLGVFETPEEDHEAYAAAARQHHGTFARLA